MVQRIFRFDDDAGLAEAAAALENDDAYKAAAQCLVMVYACAWDRACIEQMIARLRDGLPKAQIVGLTQAGGMVGDRVLDEEGLPYQGSALNVLLFEKPSFTVCSFDLHKLPMWECARQVNEKLEQLPHVQGVQLYLSDISIDDVDFYSLMYDTDRDYACFGNVSGVPITDDMVRLDSFAFDETVYEHGFVAVIFYGEHLFARVSYQYGWRSVGNIFTITKKSDMHHVDEIDGRPAVEVYEKYLGISGKQINFGNTCEFPLVTKRGNRLVARIGMYDEEAGALSFESPLSEGDRLRFSYGNPQDVLAETREDIEALEEFAPQAVWLIPCGNRRLFFRNEEKSEPDLYRKCTEEIAECYGGAELYIDREGGGILNSALISVGMREGEALHHSKERKCRCIKEPDGEYVPLEKRLAAFLNATTMELEDAAREAQVANQAKSDFLSRMSHEIRTPINAVLGMDEMILRESTQPQVRDYAMDIYTAGNTLLSLINDILDVSKIESGKLQIIPVEYDLSSMIHDLAGMIRLRAQAKNLKLEVSVDETLPSRLYGDDVRLRQVITNILTNAVKYTKEGCVYFRVGGQSDNGKVKLRIEVEDTGIGMKEEDLPKLSKAFERIEENRNRNIEGTGLGMNITTQLLMMMGSRLCVESVYGKGSKFYFVIEQRIVNAAPIGDYEERFRSAENDYSYEQSFAAPEAKVLVVDDNSLNRKVFIGLLKETGMQVTEADSGEKCLELVSKNPYHMIFLDHMMPEMDGIETLHRMKKLTDSPNLNTPVYALTANAVSGAKEMYLREGFDGFISKPIVADKLERVIKEGLPKELLVAVKRKMDGTSDVAAADKKSGAGMPEDLPDVEGLDWNYAWLHLSDRELLETTVKEFYDMIPVHADKLEQMFDSLVAELVEDGCMNQETLAQYRIRVHSMKSVAGTIGIVPLAGMANTLEYAARDGRIDVIRAMHGILIENWRGV